MRSVGLLLVLTLAAAMLAAQNTDDKSGTFSLPGVVHRVPPPDPNASVQDLEFTADVLRAEKNYADSADYYHAAIGKYPEKKVPSQLYNKLGIIYLQMFRLNDA